MARDYPPRFSRRRFLKTGALAAGSLGVFRPQQFLSGQSVDPILLSSFVADVNGNGWLGAVDKRVVQDALLTTRGRGLISRENFNYKADVFGRGIVDQQSVDSVIYTVNALESGLIEREPRPITIAWHYGWYNLEERPPGMQTVQFKGGDYRSRDSEIESIFNEQKNEFGISVDALSWIPERENKDMLDNYRRGLFSTHNLDTRHLALLYESTIALPYDGARVDFLDPSASELLQTDFEQMGRFLAEGQEQGGKVFTLDGRPVVFLFGSHTWGQLPYRATETTTLEIALDMAREAFRVAYGESPFLVGEEMNLSPDIPLYEDRARRITSFDAIYVYHHAALKPFTSSAEEGVTLVYDDFYLDHQRAILRQNFDMTSTLRNRYTGNRVPVIPNLSPGFAKPGLAVLKMGRGDYADFMKAMRHTHLDLLSEYTWQNIVGTPLMPAPIYIVGSWNEEFEGHAVLPASFNFSLPEMQQDGFDLVMAIKEVFGWNHFADRTIEA
tara:strand:+ start:5298 stop:6794 length:1497 start_codon:yes stop_codon:yes gene_type:complete